MAPVKTTSKLLACAAVLASMATSTMAFADTLCVKVHTANFRAGPGTDHDIVFKADRYFPVEVLKRKDGWAMIRDFEKETAWIAARLLSKTDAVVIKVKKGNLRDGPSLKAEMIGHVGYGEAFKIVERKGRWLKVATPDKTLGWIREDLGWGD